MYYVIYQTTNTINGKKYIGKHVTETLNDDYLGSGKALRRAITKYGRESFKKDILHVFDNEEEMNAKENELVDDVVISSEEYYNIAIGGQGGAIVLVPGHPLYEEVCRKISQAQRARSSEMSAITTQKHRERAVGMYGKKQSQKQKDAVRAAQLGRKRTDEEIQRQRESILKTLHSEGYVHPNKGRIRSEEEKQKMSLRTKSQPKKECEHCGGSFDVRNYARYHGDRCKNKI